MRLGPCSVIIWALLSYHYSWVTISSPNAACMKEGRNEAICATLLPSIAEKRAELGISVVAAEA